MLEAVLGGDDRAERIWLYSPQLDANRYYTAQFFVPQGLVLFVEK